MESHERIAAEQFLFSCGLEPTPDAIDQLRGPFLAALTIMCERGYDPDGQLWKDAGWGPQLYELMKKVARIRYYAWRGKDPERSVKEIPDVLNYGGFLWRGIADGIAKWGDEWGEPS